MRKVEAADLPGVDALMVEAGFKVRSAAGWKWLWHENPEGRGGSAHGWVVVQAGLVVGYLGNLVRRMTWRGEDLTVGVSADWYVRESARSRSMHLLRAFFKQPDVDLVVSTTANAASAPVYGSYKAKAPSQPSFRAARLWLASDGPLLAGVARDKGLWGTRVAQRVGNMVGPLRRRLGLLHPTGPTFEGAVRCHTLEEGLADDLDPHFSAVAGDGQLHPSRTSDVVRWLMADPDGGAQPVHLVARSSDTADIVGTALVVIHRAFAHPFAQARLVDLTLSPSGQSIAAAGALLSEAAAHARAHGAGVVYAPACGPRLASVLEALGGWRVEREVPAHFMRARRRKQLDAMLGAWQATGMSGDSPLCLRHAQV